MATITTGELIFWYTGNGVYSGIGCTLSLGGTIGTTVGTSASIPSGSVQNVFRDVTGTESAASSTHYVAIALRNAHSEPATPHDLTSAICWIDGYANLGSPADTISIATERPIGNPPIIQSINSINATTVQVNSFTTSWITEVSSSALNASVLGSSIGVGTIREGEWAGIWLRRFVPSGAGAASNRSCTIKVQGETSGSPFVGPIQQCFVVGWTGNQFYVIPK